MFKSTTDSVCSECHVRGVPCIEQENVRVDKSSLDRRENLRERVARLESMLAITQNSASVTPLDSVPANNVVLGRSVPATASVARGAYFGDPGFRKSAPVLSLFGNAVLTSNNGNDESGPGTTSDRHDNPLNGFPQPKELNDGKPSLAHETLLALVPHDRELSIILNAGGGWWKSWRQMYPDICSSGENTTLQEYISYAVGQRNPVVIGNALLCVAISFQHLPPDFDYSSLGFPNVGKAIIQQYVSAVDRFVFSEDDFMSSLEGIETILLQSKLYINSGQARKAWLLIRRGFSYAELVGLADTRPSRAGLCASSNRRDSVLWHLIEVDRQLSLILGLPITIIHISPAPNTELGTRRNKISSVQYRRRLFTIAGSIIDRNLHDSNPSLITTIEQDHALDDLAELMSDEWWDISSLQSHTPDMGDICDRLFTQFWHHQIKSSLHLPFMLRSATNPRYHGNRVTCFTSSREMLQIFHIVRGCTCTRFIHYCQVMDFQAFTAAVILVLGLLGYQSASHKQDKQNFKKQVDDWDLIDLTVEDLRRAASEPENSVARQSLRALETMRQARYVPFSELSKQNNSIKIAIPYFGTIFTAPGEKYAQTGMRSSSITASEPDETQGLTRQVSTAQHGSLGNEALIGFNSFMPYSSNDYSIESFGFPDFDNSSWPSMGYTDLDQEWYGLER
jgi:hypothetical protein